MGGRLGGLVAATAMVGVMLTGCGSSDGDGAPATTPATTPATAPSTAPDGPAADDWCPVTTEQVSAVVHYNMVEGGSCTWTAPELTGAVLEVYVSGTDAGHLAGSTEAIDGLADAAAFDAVDALVFERHDTYWVVQILSMGGASDIAPRDAEIELATLVLDGIG